MESLQTLSGTLSAKTASVEHISLRYLPGLFHEFHGHSTFKPMSDSSSTVPSHIQQAKAALHDAGIPVVIGQQVLDLATAFYHATPQLSLADAMRWERNRIQDELESVSSQLQRERQKTQRLEQALAAALAAPKFHQKKAYQLRKRLRAILAVLEHPQAKQNSQAGNKGFNGRR